MSDPKQPRYVPVPVSDDGSYAAGTDAWSGTPRAVEPSAGNQLAGLTPGLNTWYGAQTENWFYQTFGRHLDAIADSGAFQVEPRDALITGGLAYDGSETVGNTNTAVAGDPPALMVGDDGWIYAQTRLVVRRWHQGQGHGNANASDTDEWDQGNTCGLVANSGETDRPPVMCVDRTTGQVLAFASGGDMKVSTDRGDTWSSVHVVDSALTTALGGSASPVTAAATWNGMAICCYSVGAGPYNSRVYVADLSDLTTWVLAGTVDRNGSPSSAVIGRIIPNADRAVLLPRINTPSAVLTGDMGGGFTLTGVDIATQSTGKHNWRGDWNDQIGIYMIGNGEGDMYVSSDGAAWSQIYAQADDTFSAREILAYGRGFMVSNSQVEWAVDFVDYGPDQQPRVRRVLSAYQGNTGPVSAFHLVNAGGRWVAGRIFEGSDSIWRLEWYRGAVNPYDRNNYGV